ncbi:MAG: pitrilysin family protein [Bdellovibrionota bacterium]
MKLLLVLMFSLIQSVHLQADDSHLNIRFPVEKMKLDNGLTVLLYKDDSAPLVEFQTWFKVGSKHERPGQTGLAHLFEHMMFKGSKNFQGNAFEQILLQNGITNNAFTTRDYTAYYEKLPSTKLEIVMAIESDRMRNLIINEEMLRKEIEVVKEERRMRVDNNPDGQIYERMISTTYKVSPYRWPVIGYMKDLDALTVEDCQKFYDKYYAPNNAILVIGGDIDLAKTKKLLNKYYAPIKSFPLEKKDLASEPEQTRPRTSNIRLDISSAKLALSYRGPKVGEADAYALDVLASVLGEGASSRLYSDLVYKKQAVTEVYAFFNSMMDDGMFAIFANIRPGKSIAGVRSNLEKHILDIQKKGITQKELEKAVNRIQTDYVRGLQTIGAKTKALVLNEMVLGDYEFLFSDLTRYSSVTKEDVQKVANRYLQKESQVKVQALPVKGKK